MRKNLLLASLLFVSLILVLGRASESPGRSSQSKITARFKPVQYKDKRPVSLRANQLDSVVTQVEYSFGFGGSERPWGAPGGLWDFDDYSSSYPWPGPAETCCAVPLDDPGDSLSWQGWTFVDLTENEFAYFHRDDMVGISSPLSGNYSMWCGTGADSVCYLDWVGYGNNWKQTLSKTFTLSSGDHLQFSCRYNLESDYDFAYVAVRKWDGQIDTLGAFTGAGTLFPSYDLSAYWGMPPVEILFHVSTDDGWSDEDGDYDTQDGAFVLDDVYVGADTSDFEADDNGWIAAADAGIGKFTAIRDFASLPSSGFPDCLEMGVLTFFDSTSGGHPEGSYNVAISPVVVLDSLEVPSGGSWWITADVYAHLPESGGNYLTCRTRYRPYPGCPPDRWGPWQEGAFGYLFPDPYCGPVAFNVSGLLPDTSGQVQMGVGVVNTCLDVSCPGGSGSGSVTPESPYLDNIRLTKRFPTTISYKDTTNAGVPDMDQCSKAICMAAAFANCFWYWDQNGYTLVDHTNPDSLTENWYNDLKKVRDDLAKRMYDDKRGHLGAMDYIHEKGQSYDARRRANRADTSGLYMHDVFGEDATYHWYWKELRRCQDVLLAVSWRDTTGKEHARHWLTGAGLIDTKDRIIVSNPWKPPTGSHENMNRPVDVNWYDSYKIKKVGTDKTARIVVTDASLLQRVGNQKARELPEATVEQISAISPGPSPIGVKGQTVTGGDLSKGDSNRGTDSRRNAPSETDPLEFAYAIENDDSVEAFGFFLTFEAPYSSVSSPPGWNWIALPGYAPWNDGDDRFYYDFEGVYWYTNSSPIASFDSLSGFAISSFDTVAYDSAAAFYGVAGDNSTSHTYGYTLGPPPSASPTGVRDTQTDTGFAMALEQSWPNPFNPTTTIRFVIPEQGHVRLAVYNVAGQRVRTLLDGVQERGIRQVVWNARNDAGNEVASGIYFYRLEFEGRHMTRKAVLLR